MKELLERIQNVSMSISNVEKKMTIGEGRFSYKAVSEADVLTVVRKAEKDNGIVSIPVGQVVEKSDVINTVKKDGSPTILFSFLIRMTLRIYLVSDPSKYIDVESYGHGLDNGDKGTGKASTYARKYALMNAYKIITGEDPDKDASKDITPQNDLPVALDEINRATSLPDLTTIWNNWKGFQSDATFKAAITAKKQTL